MAFVKDLMEDFIQGRWEEYDDRYREHGSGVLQREIGPNSDSNKDKWGIITKEQRGGEKMEND